MNTTELLIQNGQLVANTLRHLADNEIDSDYFAITSASENGTEIEHELVRNTSTGVEKTPQSHRWDNLGKKHLHGRGEDQIHDVRLLVCRETPPRAWRRRAGGMNITYGSGNTSTGVEKTPSTPPPVWCSQKHLHGRGEDPCMVLSPASTHETPPRAWRRHHVAYRVEFHNGNTSTGVEKTFTLFR